MPSLASLIAQQAAPLALGASWDANAAAPLD